MHRVILFSGGLDSSYACYWTLKNNHRPFPLTMIATGMNGTDPNAVRNVIRELRNIFGANKLDDPYTVGFSAKVDNKGEEIGRHCLFISPALQYAYETDSEEILFGTFAGKRRRTGHCFPDAHPLWFDAANKLFKRGNAQVRIRTLPIYNKVQILEAFERDKVLHLMSHTKWCFRRSMQILPHPKATELQATGCGECAACRNMIATLKDFYA